MACLGESGGRFAVPVPIVANSLLLEGHPRGHLAAYFGLLERVWASLGAYWE